MARANLASQTALFELRAVAAEAVSLARSIELREAAASVLRAVASCAEIAIMLDVEEARGAEDSQSILTGINRGLPVDSTWKFPAPMAACEDANAILITSNQG